MSCSAWDLGFRQPHGLTGVSEVRTMYRLVLFAGVILPASIFLAGCNSATPMSAQNSSDYKIHAPLAQTSNIVFVMPVEGMTNPGRLVLADAIAASLRDAARPAVISGQANDQGATIFGRISEVRKRGSIAWVTAVWELRAPYGTSVANVRHEIIVDALLWEEGGVEAVNLIVAEAEPHIIGMVADHVGPLAVNEEIAMPPEERFSSADGTSQIIETNSLPMPVAPTQTESAAPQVPVEIQEVSVATELPGEENTLTESDIAAVSPVAAQRKPMRLLPKGSEMEELDAIEEIGEDANDDGGGDDGLALDEAALPANTTSRPAVALGTPDNTKLTPISWGRPSFLIRAVTGAPGDGNEVLTSGIKRAMRAQDLTISEDPRQAGYEVLGQVTIGPPVNGRQQARVVWRVLTLDGVEVGKAMQENAVIAGSLNGEWGRVGDIVAEAAAQGIQELFENQPNLASKSRQTPDFTRNPNLQQVPGRAPPPPGS